MTKKIQQTLKNILTCFESGDIPQAIAYSVFPTADIPSANWSLLNRISMYLSGTSDGRGFRQWKQANRYIKKGAKAFYILVPRFIRREKDEDDEEEKLLGFMARPVFRMEDTEGEPLDYEQIELSDLKLIEKAKEWDISVKAVPGNYRYYGYYSQNRKEIALARKKRFFFMIWLTLHIRESLKILTRLRSGKKRSWLSSVQRPCARWLAKIPGISEIIINTLNIMPKKPNYPQFKPV